MLHVALWEPEIPPNTGNVARLCAATGSRLHLIGRLGFRLDAAAVRRAGLDYWPHVDLVRHVTFEEFEAALAATPPLRGEGRKTEDNPTLSPPSLLGKGAGGLGSAPSPRVWCVETPAAMPYTRAAFRDGDCLLFGAESKGLPPAVRDKYAATTVGIPMPGGKVRSLNLATAVGVVLYEALRQLHGW
jgi:tRNA (cytidine/uridine-2'-O-)-methyltransferase